VVCDGLALAIHGFPRATLDIDVLMKAKKKWDEMKKQAEQKNVEN
jgi:hypothetical protein